MLKLFIHPNEQIVSSRWASYAKLPIWAL